MNVHNKKSSVSSTLDIFAKRIRNKLEELRRIWKVIRGSGKLLILLGEFGVCKLTSFLLFIPLTCCRPFVNGNCKEIKDGRKNTHLLFWGLTTLLWWECFPKTVKIIAFPPDKALKYIIEPSSPITSSTVSCCYSQEMQRTARPRNLAIHSFPVGSQEKKAHSIEVPRGNKKIFSLVPGSPFFHIAALWET